MKNLTNLINLQYQVHFHPHLLPSYAIYLFVCTTFIVLFSPIWILMYQISQKKDEICEDSEETISARLP